jgi:hypothetical protein
MALFAKPDEPPRQSAANPAAGDHRVEWRLQVARDLNLISHERCAALSSEIVEIRKMTYGYRKTVLGEADAPPSEEPKPARKPKPKPKPEPKPEHPAPRHHFARRRVMC